MPANPAIFGSNDYEHSAEDWLQEGHLQAAACDINPIWTISGVSRIHSTVSANGTANNVPGPMADSFPRGNSLVYASFARIFYFCFKLMRQQEGIVSILCAITENEGEPILSAS